MRFCLLSAGCCLLSFLLRTYLLGAQSLWFDEGWSWHLAKLSLGEMAQVTAGDRSPVLYYALLHGWILLVGESEFALRFFSVFADVLTTALVMALAKKATGGGWLVVGMAGLLYAVCPFAIFYAQETRMYAWVALLCTASNYGLLKWLARRDSKYLFYSALCLALAIHSHYYAVFLLPAQAMLALFHGFGRVKRRDLFVYILSAACVVASVVPWLLYARGGFAYDDGFDFPLNTIDGRLLEWLQTFVGGGFGFGLPAFWGWVFGGLGLLGLLAFVCSNNKRMLTIFLVLVVVPLLAATVAVRVVYPYRSVFHPRYLIYVAPMLVVFAVSWVQRLRDNIQPLAASLRLHLSLLMPFAFCLLLFWLPATHSYFTQPNLIRDDYRAATRHVVEAIEAGDVVVMSRDNYAIRYYWRTLTAEVGKDVPLLAAPEGLHGVLSSAEPITQKLNALHPKRVRMMLWQDNVVDAQKLVETLMWANGRQLGEYSFGRIRLPLFELTSKEIQPLAMLPVRHLFGGLVQLTARWMPMQARAGDLFYVVLQWQAVAPIPKDYKVFVHVLNANKQVVFQKDKLPIDDLRPMRRWKVGELLRDPYAMVIPANLAAGEYTVMIGIYDPITGERLRAEAGAQNSPKPDAILLGIVNVTQP